MCIKWYEVTDLQQLRSACQTFEAALRGEQGIIFEDGYEVNVAALRGDLVDAEEELKTVRAELEEAKKKLQGYYKWERSVNEALNSGDGNYRP